MTPLAPHAPARSMQTGLVARYQLIALAVGLSLVRWRRPELGLSFLTGAMLVALNLQLSRAMLPVLAHLRRRNMSSARQMAWIGAASLSKLLLQLAVAAVVLLNWPPQTQPFMWGLATFLVGLAGAACHTLARAARPAPGARPFELG